MEVLRSVESCGVNRGVFSSGTEATCCKMRAQTALLRLR